MTIQTDSLYYGDCLEVMANWPSACVDLIYLDPPFNSNANYNILFGKDKEKDDDTLAQMTAFTDTWQWDDAAAERVQKICNAIDSPAHYAIQTFQTLFHGGNGMLAYLSYMAERLVMMQRILKPTGSIYLHCDPTASHYLKILMDEIFGRKNFRNEIVWCYHGPGSPKMRQFNRKSDTIFWYSNGDTWTFNKDAVRMSYKGSKPHVGGYGITKEIAESYGEKGKVPENWWEMRIAARSKTEYLGYPTQKPIALLKRIISASSNEGDIVLDPFCGCGTTIDAANRLHRKWIGIDISTYAIEVIRRERLNDMGIEVTGIPKDIKAAQNLAREKPFDFEKWAITRIHGFVPNKVQRGDGGIDGRGIIHNPMVENKLCIAQVKGGKPNVNDLRAFCGSLVGGKAALGVFFTLKKWETPTVRQCIAEVGKLKIGATEYNRLIMYSIEEYFQGIKPNLPALAHPRTGEALQEELLDLRDDKRQ